MLDQDNSHRAQERENADPEERIRPVPLMAAAITLAMVLFGVGYIFLSDPFGNSSLGDRRTVADLSGPAPAAAGAAVDGKALFAAQCAACHQATGQGLPGVFPPLAGSEWVTGEPRVLANILLHGVTGPITVAGKSYEGAMPAFRQLGDAELAAVA
ncbi:MAG: c-type cytochrome, partial [Burkholderiaceae bacterium]|nr:c-type cytochrome [Burkholderiaceae bacterium]